MELRLNLPIQLNLRKCSLQGDVLVSTCQTYLTSRPSLWNIAWPMRRTVHFLPWHTSPCRNLPWPVCLFFFTTFSVPLCSTNSRTEILLISETGYTHMPILALPFVLLGLLPAFSHRSKLCFSFMFLFPLWRLYLLYHPYYPFFFFFYYLIIISAMCLH